MLSLKAPLLFGRLARALTKNVDYLKRTARIGELNGHPPGSDGPTADDDNNGGGGDDDDDNDNRFPAYYTPPTKR